MNGVAAELSSGAIHNVVFDKSVRKVMDPILVCIGKNEPLSTTSPMTYPCGICNEEWKSDPGEESCSSIGCE